MNREVDKIRQCEEGDTYYKIKKDKVVQIQIAKVTYHDLGHYSYKDSMNDTYFGHSFGTALFKTKQEADDELYRRERVKEKRRRLKEYEELLNEKLNLEGHFIVK